VSTGTRIFLLQRQKFLLPRRARRSEPSRARLRDVPHDTKKLRLKNKPARKMEICFVASAEERAGRVRAKRESERRNTARLLAGQAER